MAFKMTGSRHHPHLLKLVSLVVLGCMLNLQQHVQAAVVGSPPISEINIPTEPYITFFDLAQDHNNVLYVSYDKGVKIFDGSRWHTLLIPHTYLTRILYFDQKDRVYVGGFDFFGYISRNPYGHYEFVDLTPKENPIQFASIWSIASCQNRIFFRALNHVFALQPDSGKIDSWSFAGRLGDIACFDNKTLLQDRSSGIKELVANEWLDSSIQLEDNSLIYELEILDNQRMFIRSLSENWRVIENNQIKPISFKSPLDELASYGSSLTLNDSIVAMGGKSGTLTLLDFNSLSAESFKLSDDQISAIIKSNDGGLLILSNLKIYHLTWPSPWRIQGSDTGISSDIFDIKMWNNRLYATSRAGVYVEDSDQISQQHFKQLDWTSLEAWNLLPLNANEILLADSQHVHLIKHAEKQRITDVIYPRVFQVSKYHPNHIYLHTEFDTRLLTRSGDHWSNWVVAEGKPSSVIEASKDTLLITTVDGRFTKVLLNQNFDGVEATIDMSNQPNMSTEGMTALRLFPGYGDQIWAVTHENYYQYTHDEFIETDLLGLAAILPATEFSSMGTDNNNQIWANSATQVFIKDAKKPWQKIDASAYIHNGIYDVEFLPEQIKLAGNGVILSYLTEQPINLSPPHGQMLITAAQLKRHNDVDVIDIPVGSSNPFVFGSNEGGLTFQFSFTDIKNAPATLYQYRLKGHNNSWSPYSHNTQASFLQLPAGAYEFEVKALDSNGQTHTSQPLPFVVEPVWYLNTWAKFLWALLSLLALFLSMKLFLKWREKVHEEQKLALKATINEKTQALKLANQALQDLAHKDSLTGLSNRLFLDKYINDMIENRVNDIAAMMIDMDHFKKYNDTFGHLAGDHLLAKFAQSLQTMIKRKQHLVARYGGEEFLVIMPKPTKEQALKTAEQIRKHTEGQAEKTTISIGIAFSQKGHAIKSAKDVFELIDQADKALYEAKTTGRNQVSIYN